VRFLFLVLQNECHSWKGQPLVDPGTRPRASRSCGESFVTLCEIEANPKSGCAGNAGFEKTAVIQSAGNNAYSAPATSAFGALAISSALAPVLFVSAFHAALCSFAAR
jgi:hypothetical protein